jgi:hypothetical protein
MRLKVLYHGNCFDGCSSAAIFSRFMVDSGRARAADITYVPLHHQQGDPFPKDAFDGDVNACLDFRYSASPKLHWWFDHHASAFPTPADRAAFEREPGDQKFWDPKAPSCTGFIARTLEARVNWRADGLSELIHWAEIIDAARFPTAAMAVRLHEPALRIMTLLESTKDPEVPTRLIESLKTTPLAEIVEQSWVKDPLAPILDRHFKSIDTVKSAARVEGDVVMIDLAGSGIEGANKFIAYDLFPEARYTVVVSQDTKRSKVSVGSNPWSKEPRTHDISKLCEKYGGGGHPVVGAVTLEGHELDKARRIAREIGDALKVG